MRAAVVRALRHYLPLLLLLAPWATSPAEAKRRALVIGIETYANLPSLTNPRHDAEQVSAKLQAAGYATTTIVGADTRHDKLTENIGTFIDSVRSGDEVVVYYSGHGVDLNGDNMIVPSDTPGPRDIGSVYSLHQRLIAIKPIMQELEDHEAAMQVWVLDACRNNPFAGGTKSFGESGGLAQFNDRQNSYVIFAAKYGQTARDTLPSDPPSPPNPPPGSPFTRVFVSMFDTYKGQDINAFAGELRRRVVASVGSDPQWPVFENGVLNEWCFDTCPSTRPVQVAIASVAKSAPRGVLENRKKTDNIVTGALSSEAARSPEVVASLLGSEPVVFLGKRSSRGCSVASISDLYPFGCATLQKVVAHFSGDHEAERKELIGQTITVTTGVNVRRGLPKSTATGTAYGCKIRVLTQGSGVVLKAMVALQYAGDTFYWGRIDVPDGPCTSQTVGTGQH